ncbi:phage virion morphogenesis protein [Vibrio sp. YMD68]|uniref:phage virion morphogenesis protein n=1 Tax=Vibrio sp. YMD68 TaxID=3042300 RepID=UPI00249B2274|nr:phage virion morphogenesis protein [Vibrio sp. YMD68]WGV98828.1 phage virion morphogenesis protein [Vibrio sp. YMD68]WGW01245.1 phage virion morphogenesis protein [Vibrio sp. YMD68]
MAGVQLVLQGDLSPIEQALNGLLMRLESPQDMLDEMGAAMVNQTILRFNSERGPDGISWIPSIRAMLEGGKTLQDSGRLRHSITHNTLPSSVEWGSNVVYAAIHQLGGKAGRHRSVTIDAREYLGLNKSDEQILGDIALRYMVAGFGNE